MSTPDEQPIANAPNDTTPTAATERADTGSESKQRTALETNAKRARSQKAVAVERILKQRREKRAERGDRIRRTEEPGAPPGTMTVEEDAVAPNLTVFSYDAEGCDELKITHLKDLESSNRRGVTWIDIDGVGDSSFISRLGEMFGVHHLTLEDMVHVHQRPKIEVFPDYIYIVARMPVADNDHDTEQLSLLLLDGVVLTVQEGLPGDCMSPVRRRLRESIGQIREKGADYLCYAILDTVIDHYFPEIETIGDRLERLEDEVLDEPKDDLTRRVHALKRELMVLRRVILPTQEMLGVLVRTQSPLILDETHLYLRDVQDHTGQLLDQLESFREVGTALIDTHLALEGHRMNQVMKMLTVVGAVFLPLTFITGLYGMNFDTSAPTNMPELGWKFGYVSALALMAVSTGISLFYFYRKDWVRREDLPF